MQNNILNTYSKKLWNRLGNVVKGSVVYMDDSTAECLHWNGGLGYFLKCGAHAVNKLNDSEPPSTYWNDVVFFLNSPVASEIPEMVKNILTVGQFIKCTIVSSEPDGNLKHHNSFDPYSKLKKNILEWSVRKNYEASIISIPVFMACIMPSFFVMPPFSHLFPPLETAPVPGQNNYEGPRGSLGSSSVEIFIKTLSLCLDHFLNDINVKEDIFVWGELSHSLGTEVLKLPSFRARRKNNSCQRASLLVLDRTLDLSPCLTHQCDCILDSVLRVLPPLPGHSCCDVAVDMTPLLYPNIMVQNRESLGILPGSLAGQKDQSSVLSSMVFSKTKECLMEINRKLVSEGSRHGFKLDATVGRITPESLLQKVHTFSGSPSAICESLDLLQQTLAVVQCLNSPLHEKESLMLSTERLLVQNMVASQEGPTRNLLHVMAHMKERNMSLEDIIIILAHLASVCDDSLWKPDDEVKLQGALAEAIFQDLENLPSFLSYIIGDTSQESNVLSGVSSTFKCLKAIGKGRQNFKKYRSVLQQDNPALPATYHSVFQQLLKDILDPSRPEIPDLQCISTGITDMLKSGLGLFMNMQKPHPQDNPILIILVLGGMTASEVKTLRDMAGSSKKSPQLILGTTRICKPANILASIFSRTVSFG